MIENEVTRVLIVDDDEAVLDSLPDVLASAAVTVFTAADLESAVRVLEQHAIDLVITDLRLRNRADTDGLELISWVKARHPGTDIVLITGWGGPALREEALRRGAAAYWE